MPEAPNLTRADHAIGMSWGAIDLNLLIVFDVVMQERNLTRAGRRLGLSQPAASHALARLRHMLHDDLFIRAPDGMRPTPRAEQIAQPVRDALRELRIILEPEAFDPASSTREFSLAVNNYAARAIVPALARTVGNLAPRVSLDINPIGMREVLDQLDAGGMDVALTALVDGGERFKCVRVTDDDFVVLLDGSHPAAAEAAVSVERLAEIPHIAITSTGDDTSFVDDALEQHGLTRTIATRVPFLSVVLMLVGSDRLAVVPRRVADDLARICPLVARELPFPVAAHRAVDDLASSAWTIMPPIAGCAI